MYVRVYDKRFTAHDLETTRLTFLADKQFSLAAQNVEGVYALAQYDAYASNVRAHTAATINEATANAATNRALAANRADVYDAALAEIAA